MVEIGSAGHSTSADFDRDIEVQGDQPGAMRRMSRRAARGYWQASRANAMRATMSDTQPAEKGIRDYLRDYEHASPALSMIVRLSWLRDLLSTIDALRSSYEERGRVIEALAKGERPTCETCDMMRRGAVNNAMVCGQLDVFCAAVGNGCYAHTPKGGAK